MDKRMLSCKFAVQDCITAFYTGGPAQLSADGKHLFTACNNLVVVTDINSGRQLLKIGNSEEESPISSFCLLADGIHLAVAYQKNLLLKLWQWSDGTLIRTWKSLHKANIICMATEETSQYLATGSGDFGVKVWDLKRQLCLHSFKSSAVITVLSFFIVHSGGDQKNFKAQLFAGSADGKVKVWDLQTGKVLITLEKHSSKITCLCIQSMTLYIGSLDMTVSVWHVDSLTLQKVIPTFEAIYSLAVLSKEDADASYFPKNDRELGQIFITGSENGQCKVWSVLKATVVFKPEIIFESTVTALHYVAGSYISAVTEDHNFTFLNISSLTVTKQMVGNSDEIYDVAFLPASEAIAVCCNSSAVRLYSLNGLDCSLLRGHTDSVLCADAMSRDDADFLATGGKDNDVRIWKVAKTGNGHATVNCVGLGSGHTRSVSSLKFSGGTGTSAWLVSVSHDTTMKIWSLDHVLSTSKHESSTLPRIESVATVVAHSSDVTCVDVARNQKLIATGSLDKTVKIWQVSGAKKGKLVASLKETITQHKRGIWDLCFSPVEQLLASASGDLTVKVFSLSNFSCLKSFEEHSSAVTKVRFLPSGLQLVSADTSGLLRLWTLKNSECVDSMDAHSEKVWALEVCAVQSSTSTNEAKLMLISGGGDSKVQVWKDITEATQQEKLQKQAVDVSQEQALSNLLQQQQYEQALKLAIVLNRPHSIFAVLREIVSQTNPDDNLSDQKLLKRFLQSLDDEQINKLLTHVADWNTNSKSCFVAQVVFSCLLKLFTIEQLVKLPATRSSTEALLAYSERHAERLAKLSQQSMFVGYTWSCMRLDESSNKL